MGFQILTISAQRSTEQIKLQAYYEELCLQVKKITQSDIGTLCSIPYPPPLTLLERISWLEMVKDFYLVFASLPKSENDARMKLFLYAHGAINHA